MQPFSYSAPGSVGEAVGLTADPGRGAEFLAGGTDMLQLMKEGQRAPRQVVDIGGLPLRGITAIAGGGVRIGALTRMSEAAADPRLKQGWPAVVQALDASASPQVRNMATMGGNVLQRTRCLYFRDSVTPCNKRQPGSGCGALDGLHRGNAILGGSAHCIATHASDLAVTLAAFDARVVIQGPQGGREIPFAELHRLPGDTPQTETVLAPGELITALILPASAAAERSAYVKLRDRASFEWALVSAVVGLDLTAGRIREARVAVGGVGTKPWRLPKVEQAMAGQMLEPGPLDAAARLSAEGTQPRPGNAFKVELMKRAITRAAAVAGGLA